MIFDEAQELDDNTQASFLPAISASLNPQTIYTGTPPDENSPGETFRTIRDKAIDGETNRTAWFEYGVEEIGNTADKTRWAMANPALGRRIMLETIESEFEQMAPDTFARERLGWWAPVISHKDELAIPEAIWDEFKSDEIRPEGKMAYGVKFSPDGSMVSLAGAVIPKKGSARIELIEQRGTGQGTQWLANWLNESNRKAACVVIDGKNGVDALVDKISDSWKFKDSVIRPSTSAVLASVSMLTDALNEHTVTWYAKQEALRDSAVTSIRRKIGNGGGWGFGGENSTPIEACALALYGAKTSKRNPQQKMRIG